MLNQHPIFCNYIIHESYKKINLLFHTIFIILENIFIYNLIFTFKLFYVKMYAVEDGIYHKLFI